MPELPEIAMPRAALPVLAVLVACTPLPEESEMRDLDTPPAAAVAEAGANAEAVEPAPDRTPKDSPAAASGRRILSTAFVMIGPDGRLTVEQRDGSVLVLRDVVMRAKDYCGLRDGGASPGQWHCGRYADVAAARPGAVSRPR